MQISAIINLLETIAPPQLQETYDNAGLIAGSNEWECNGILVSLDATEPIIDEAIKNKCNLVVAHHPIVFSALKKITGRNYVEKTLIKAIKNDVAIYSIHTNLDNISSGVNGRIGEMIGLSESRVLVRKSGTTKKLFTFVPSANADKVRAAIFNAGAGNIGNYSECSFNVEGVGTFKGGVGANPYVGEVGKQQREKETKIEVVFPSWLEQTIVKSLIDSHPYEEVAFDIVTVDNTSHEIGSGLVGEIRPGMSEPRFLEHLKNIFQLKVIRHSPLLNRQINKVAVCGGAGSFLISKAISAGADALVSADFKYHEFFDANDRIVIFDIGHFESEQFTIDLLHDLLTQKIPNFAVLKSGVKTNPINYYF